MDIWILTSFLAAVFSGLEKIAHRFNILKVKDVYSYTIIFQFLCAAIVSPAVVMNPVFPNVTEIKAYVFLILAAACWAGFSLLTFHADKYLEASVKSGISRLRLVWVSLIGYLFFNESFSLWQFMGVFLIWGSPFIVSKIRGKGTTPGFMLEISASLMIAFALTFDKICADYFSEPVIVLFSFFNSAIIISLIRKGRFYFKMELIKVALPASSFSAICYLLLIYSLKHGVISMVISIYMISPVLVTFLGIYLLKEKENVRLKLFSALVATIGCLLTLR